MNSSFLMLVALVAMPAVRAGTPDVDEDPEELRQSINPYPSCKCAASWIDSAGGEECKQLQFGCPTTPCDGDSTRWCHVEVSPCREDMEGFGIMNCASTETAPAQCSGNDCHEFQLDVKTSRMTGAGSVTLGVTGLGGANVQYLVDGEWTPQITFVTDAPQGSLITHKVMLSKWPTKVNISARGQDSWGYDSMSLKTGADSRTLLEYKELEIEACLNSKCLYYVGLNRDIAQNPWNAYPIPNGKCAHYTCENGAYPQGSECKGPNCDFGDCCVWPPKCTSCPTGMALKADIASHDCGQRGCTVAECCERRCEKPLSPYDTSGCDTSSGNLLEKHCEVKCNEGFSGTASATCGSNGYEFELRGCGEEVGGKWRERVVNVGKNIDCGKFCGGAGNAACQTETTGSCRFFGCASSRGETMCVASKCVCKPGHCISPDASKCVADSSDFENNVVFPALARINEEDADLAETVPSSNAPVRNLTSWITGLVVGFISGLLALLAWARYSRRSTNNGSHAPC